MQSGPVIDLHLGCFEQARSEPTQVVDALLDTLLGGVGMDEHQIGDCRHTVMFERSDQLRCV